MPLYDGAVGCAENSTRNEVEPFGTVFHRAKNILFVASMCLIFLLSAGASGKNAFTVVPDRPLLNVPFYVHASTVKDGNNIFISKSEKCETSENVTKTCVTKTGEYCNFTITDAQMKVNLRYDFSVPKLYLCTSEADGKHKQELNVDLVNAFPRYVTRGKSTTVTFGEATPKGTVISFHKNDNCSDHSLIGTRPNVTLGDDRTINVTAGERGVIYLCANVTQKRPSSLTYQQRTEPAPIIVLPAATLIVVPSFSAKVSNVLRNAEASFHIPPSLSFPWGSLSTSPICKHLMQEPKRGKVLQMVEIPVLVPKGDYFLCVGFPYYDDKHVYAPSENRVSVTEYGVQPHTLYAKHSTIMKLSRDAAGKGKKKAKVGSGFEIIISSKPDCQTASTTVKDDMKLTMNNSGTYYACVRGTFRNQPVTVLGANITVLDAPTVNVKSSHVISGLEITVSTSGLTGNKPGIIVGLSPDECKTVQTKAEVKQSGTSTFPVPEDALSKMSLCMSTPMFPKDPSSAEEGDSGYVYSVQKVDVSRYELSHGVLFVGETNKFTLDSRVALPYGTLGAFGSGNCNNRVTPDFDMNRTTLEDVRFAKAGIYVLCVKLPITSPASSSSYSNIGSITVYGPAKLSPFAIVLNTQTMVTVSRIPPNAPVNITTSADCKSGTVVSGTADGNGMANLTLTHETEEDLVVCVGYRGSKSSDPWEMRRSTKLIVAPVKVLPTTVMEGKQNRVNFVMPDRDALKSLTYFLANGDNASCDKQNPATDSPVTIPSYGPAYFETAANLSGTWTVCLKSGSSTFKPVGTIKSGSQLEVATDPPVGVVFLPTRIKFSGSALSELKPTRYRVVASESSCSTLAEKRPDDQEGSMNPRTGVADPLITTKEGEFTVCIGWQHPTGDYFVYGGKVTTKEFKLSSKYAVRFRTNNIVATPLLRDGLFFLVPCPPGTTCATPVNLEFCKNATDKYYTGPDIVLEKATVGQYVLCYEDQQKMGVTVGEHSISVINPITASFDTAGVRQHKSVRLKLDAHNTIALKAGVTVYMMPPDVECSSANETSESFVFSGNSLEQDITITKISPFMGGVKVCVGLSDHDKIPALTFDLLHYMTPATIVTNRKMKVRSSVLKSGAAKLSTSSDCSDNLLGESEIPIVNHVSDFYVKACNGSVRYASFVHYCEKKDDTDKFESRGIMRLINTQKCADGDEPDIRPTTVSPAVQVTDFGIKKELLINPRLSKTDDCTKFVEGRSALTPRYDEVMRLYVCVSAKGDPSFVFTTDEPTLRVNNFKAAPATVHGRASPTSEALMPVELKLNYATQTSDTFLSDCLTCREHLGRTPTLSKDPISSTLLLTGIAGKACLCVAAGPGEPMPIPIAEVLVVNPPYVVKIDPAVVSGAPFHATLQAPVDSAGKLLYSLVPGDDKDYVFAPLYAQPFRGVFLSTDVCMTKLEGTEVGYISKSGKVQIPSLTLSNETRSVSLCAGTPAGNVSVRSTVEVSNDIIFPSSFVLGANTEVYIPLSPNSVFHLRRDESCDGEDIVPVFATNEEARGVVSFRRSNGAGLPPPGSWTLCREDFATTRGLQKQIPMKQEVIAASPASSLRLRPLAHIEAHFPVYYDVTGRDIVTGVRSIVYLKEDLRAGSLLPGFSLDRSCSRVSDNYGSWSVVGGENPATAQRIVIMAKESVDQIYLCASTPINKSVASIPATSALRFFQTGSNYPATLSSCESNVVTNCELPEITNRRMFYRIIKGDCCSLADRINVVGDITEDGDDKCHLAVNGDQVDNFPIGSDYSVCGWDYNDDSYCLTLATSKINTEVCRAASSGLSKGALASIVILSIIIFMLAIVMLVFFLMRLRAKRDPGGQLVVADKMLMRRTSTPSMIFTPSEGSQVQNNPLLLGLCRGVPACKDSTQTITVGTSGDENSPSWRGETPDRMRWNLWEGIECDDRDQIALQEARDRYNMALAFTDGLERIRIAEKERDLAFELSDHGQHTFDRSFKNRTIAVPIGMPQDEPDVYLNVSNDTRVPKRSTPCGGHDSFGKGSTPDAYMYAHEASPPSSSDSMNYTTTQRFYDEAAFIRESEEGRRLRLANWEEEEWQMIVESEFHDYIRLEQDADATPLPLPQAVVVPFASAIQQEELGKSPIGSNRSDRLRVGDFTPIHGGSGSGGGYADHRVEDEECEIYDAPGEPLPLPTPVNGGSPPYVIETGRPVGHFGLSNN
ncbi:hypothetical protein TRVL_05817 [Trypanosoma vivax]|nr:hypothetical protein TRVL_05817 [Trypanosoma vivax]